jgi:integrase
MATIKVSYLVNRPNKAGNRWYWQPSKFLIAAGWKPLTLGKDEAAAIEAARKRNADVAAWRAGGMSPAQSDVARIGATLGALIDRFRREHMDGLHPVSGLPRIRAKSRATYATAMKRLDMWAGADQLAAITPARVLALRDASLATIGHVPTYVLLSCARTLFAFAERKGMMAPGSNPARSFDLPRPRPRRHVWERADEAAFIASAIALEMPSMAFALELAIYTGQRVGDLIAMTDRQIKPMTIDDAAVRDIFAGSDGQVMSWQFDQTKTSDAHAGIAVEMSVPFEPAMLARIEAALTANRARAPVAPLHTPVLINDKTGKPWELRRFQEAWTVIRDHAAGATGREAMRALVWHDLRRTRVVRLRRQGMALESIAAITGHSLGATLEMLRVYGPVDAQITAAAHAEALRLGA